MKPTVFIHTNAKQYLGALVAQYSMRRNSKTPNAFDVKIINHKDFGFFAAREGQTYIRYGERATWHNDDLQSFTPLRFMPPQLMNYQGRAVVTDPDVFAVGDINELLSRDMNGKAIMCRYREREGDRPSYLASSVMLLDCEKLKHWHCENQFNAMFELKHDYREWINLKLEPESSIGLFEPEWNDFDNLTEKTKLLHNTRRRTQPWKTGLRVDFNRNLKPTISQRFRAMKNQLLGRESRYRPHPDTKQEAFFFGLLRECLQQGIVNENLLREEIARDHLRHDAFQVLDRIKPMAA